MKKTVILSLILFAGITNLQAQNVTVGGELMYAQKNIVENAVNSKDHTTLVAAVKAADLVDVLKGNGPFTVFAPVNDAFENLPDGTVATLLKAENKSKLTAVLTYHVLPGKITAKDLMAAIKKGKGKASFKTVQGSLLYFSMNGDMNVSVWDEQNNRANISIYDIHQRNGVIHSIDKVLMPKM